MGGSRGAKVSMVGVRRLLVLWLASFKTSGIFIVYPQRVLRASGITATCLVKPVEGGKGIKVSA